MTEENVFWYKVQTNPGEITKPVVKIIVKEKLEFSEGTERQVDMAKETVARMCAPGFLHDAMGNEAFNPHKIAHRKRLALWGKRFTSDKLEELLENDHSKFLELRGKFDRKVYEESQRWDEEWDRDSWKQVWQNMPREEREEFMSYQLQEAREKLEGLFDG